MLATPACAGGAGTTSGDFLRLGIGARPAALGDSYVGLADDVDAIYYNPAGLALVERHELSLMHDALQSGVYHEWLAYATPLGEHRVFAGSADVVYVAPFNSYDQNDVLLGQTSAMEGVYSLAYALAPLPCLSLGSAVKIIYSRLDTSHASSLAADFGVLLHPAQRVGLGAALLNVGSGLRYVDETFPLPTAFKVGLSWRAYDDSERRHQLTLLTDCTAPFNEGAYVSAGAELRYVGVVALRLGGSSYPDSGTGLTAGAGLTFKGSARTSPELDVDYAFSDMGLLTQAHRVSLKIKFGAPREHSLPPVKPKSYEPTLEEYLAHPSI